MATSNQVVVINETIYNVTIDSTCNIAKIEEVQIKVCIACGVGFGAENFAIADLTFTGNRTHDAVGYFLLIKNIDSFTLSDANNDNWFGQTGNIQGGTFTVNIGDYNGANNSTYLTINDTSSLITLHNQLNLDEYGLGNYSGTPAYYLAVTATGDVIEIAAASLTNNIYVADGSISDVLRTATIPTGRTLLFDAVGTADVTYEIDDGEFKIHTTGNTTNLGNIVFSTDGLLGGGNIEFGTATGDFFFTTVGGVVQFATSVSTANFINFNHTNTTWFNLGSAGVRVSSTNGFRLYTETGVGGVTPLRFYDLDNSNYTAFKVNDVLPGNTTYILPDTDGNPNEFLKTDGAGNLDWASSSGLGIVDGTGATNQIAYWVDTDTITGSSDFTYDGSIVNLQHTGTVKVTTDFFIITNDANAADMDSTGTAILFKQYYNDGAPAAVNSGRVDVITDTDWTITASTQDSTMVLSSATDGALVERLYLGANTYFPADLGVGKSNPTQRVDIEDSSGADTWVQVSNGPGSVTVLMGASSTGAKLTAGTADTLGLGAGGTEDYLTISTLGALAASEYGGGTITGTATYALAVDVNGNIIEEALGSADTNMAENDLTANGVRNHTWAANNLTHTFTTGNFTISNTGAADAFVINGTTGAVQLGDYGAGLNTGTATYSLAVDVNGNVIEEALGAGSNLATDNLTQDAEARTYSMNANSLTFNNGSFNIEQDGTVKVITDLLTVTNIGDAADMDGTGTAILFRQHYNDASPAAVSSARIYSVTETDWTSVASTQDAYLAMSVAVDGTLTERFKISSTGQVQLAAYGTATFTGTAAYMLAVDASGNVIEETIGGGVTGSGAANRIAIWSGASTLTSDAGFTWITGQMLNSAADANLLVRSTTGTNDAAIIFENSGDANNSWKVYRAADGTFTIGLDAAQPFATSTPIMTIDPSTKYVKFDNGTGDNTLVEIESKGATSPILWMEDATNLWQTSIVSGDVLIEPELAEGNYIIRDFANNNIFDLNTTNGQLQLGDYGGGTITGTATYLLGVDTNGNIIEETLIGGSGAANQVAYWSGANTLTSSADFTYDGSVAVLQTTGTTKANTNIFTLVNDGNAVDMDGTSTSILFQQFYNDGTPAADDSGAIAVVTETDWTAVAATRDSYMGFKTSLDGSLVEYFRIKSDGSLAAFSYGSGTVSGTSAYYLTVDASGNILEEAWTGAPVDGSGAANQVAYFSDANTLTSSANLTFNGTNLSLIGSGPDPTFTIDASAGGQALFDIENANNIWRFNTSSTALYLEPQTANGIFAIRNLANAITHQFDTTNGSTTFFGRGGASSTVDWYWKDNSSVNRLRMRAVDAGDAFFWMYDNAGGNPLVWIETNGHSYIDPKGANSGFGFNTQAPDNNTMHLVDKHLKVEHTTSIPHIYMETTAQLVDIWLDSTNLKIDFQTVDGVFAIRNLVDTTIFQLSTSSSAVVHQSVISNGAVWNTKSNTGSDDLFIIREESDGSCQIRLYDDASDENVRIASGTNASSFINTGGNFGIGTTTPGYFMSVVGAGTAKADKDFIGLTNTVNAIDMDGTKTSILFRQYYYDAATPAAVSSGRITVGTLTDWTSTAASQDAYMSFHTVDGGSFEERLYLGIDTVRIADYGGGTITGTPLYTLAVTAQGDIIEEALHQPGLRLAAEQSSTFTADVGKIYPVNTTSAAITCNPPGSPSAEDKFAIVDSRENSSTNSITVDLVTASQKIYATSQNIVINTDGTCATFRYVDATIGWILESSS